MAGSTKLFSLNREYYNALGIRPIKLKTHRESMNARSLTLIISLVLWALSSAAFLVYEARSLLELGISFFATCIAVLLTCVFLMIIWKIKDTWLFFENCERFIGRSK